MNTDLEEIKNEVARAANAAFRSMDYPILRILLDLMKNMQSAYDENDGEKLNYLNNKGLWDIGCYIKDKMAVYQVVPNNFFDSIEENIIKHLKFKKQLYFCAENLKQSLKLV